MTVAELLTHHVKTGTAVTKKSGVVIKKAILRKLQAGSKGTDWLQHNVYSGCFDSMILMNY